MTRVFALLGDPVAHSLSPRLHNAAFHALAIDARYHVRQTAAAELPQLLRSLIDAGGGGNVTLPHKSAAAALLDHATEAVRRTGACNTFWRGEHGLHGDNTDVAGFLAAAAHHGVQLRGADVLLLGAGGAAAAVLVACAQAGAARVTLCNRDSARAHALVQRLALDLPVTVSAAIGDAADIVVNATSLGLHPGDPHPLQPERIPAGAAVLDLVYAPAGTAWTRAAAQCGHTAFDGTEMLLRQAAASFARWLGREAPLDAMRAALTGH